MLRVVDITPDARGFEALSLDCERQGHRMLQRFAQNWRNGTNRFDQPGERVFGAYDGDRLVGVCGRNRDPFDDFARAGRVRHLYVSSADRGTGLGRVLVQRVIEGADQWFDYLNTNCQPEAASFYEHLGFAPVTAMKITHRYALRR